MIAGPGNAWVTEAKRQLYGDVGIDGLAGPSELVVVADETADAREVALDALAQAEHGADSPVVVVSADSALLDEIDREVAELLPRRASVADAPLALVEAPSLEARAWSSATPSHPSTSSCDSTARQSLRPSESRDASSSAGRAQPPSATTSPGRTTSCRRAARRASRDLWESTLSCDACRSSTSHAEAAEALAPAVDAIAQAEGLPVHGESARARTASESTNLQVT